MTGLINFLIGVGVLLGGCIGLALVITALRWLFSEDGVGVLLLLFLLAILIVGPMACHDLGVAVTGKGTPLLDPPAGSRTASQAHGKDASSASDLNQKVRQ